MRSNHSQKGPNIEDENPYWLSFSDIMAGLLVIFILAAIALMIELTQKTQAFDDQIRELEKAERIREELIQEIAKELNQKNIPVTISDNDTVLRIPEEVLTFKQGKFNIPEDPIFRMTSLEIGKVLYTSIIRDDRFEYLDTIFIEGHTDRIPYFNKRVKGNWGLSTFRAISVWEFWNSELPFGEKLDRLRNHNGKPLFSVSGYAQTRPLPCTVDENTSFDCPNEELEKSDKLRKNRRIDIRFTVKRPAIKDYRDVRESI